MDMSTEQVMEYLSSRKKGEQNTSETEVNKSEESKTASVETTPKTEEAETSSSSEKEHKDGVTGAEEQPAGKGSDDSKDQKPAESDQKTEKVEQKSPTKQDPQKKDQKPSHREQRDYAFIKLQEKHKKQIEKLTKRIEELEAQSKREEGLRAEHFKKSDGTPDHDSYLDWREDKRDRDLELKNLKAESQAEQEQYAIERDAAAARASFKTEQEAEDYFRMQEQNAAEFVGDLDKFDPNRVALNYIFSLNNYPVVLKKLMDKSDFSYLKRVFRSTDPAEIKHNIARVSDEILDEYYSFNGHSAQRVPDPVQRTEQPRPQVSTPTEPSERDHSPKKSPIPITGRQTTTAQSSAPVVKDRRYWNEVLHQLNGR